MTRSPRGDHAVVGDRLADLAAQLGREALEGAGGLRGRAHRRTGLFLSPQAADARADSKGLQAAALLALVSRYFAST